MSIIQMLLAVQGLVGPTTGIFYAGCTPAVTNNVNRINTCGTAIGTQTTIGTARRCIAGAPVGTNGLFYGGYFGTAATDVTTRINKCAVLVGSQTNVGYIRMTAAGAPIGSNGVFFGGMQAPACTSLNTTTRINSCGAAVGSTNTLSGTTGRMGLGGGKATTNGVFYGGDSASGCGAWTLLATRVNSCGTQVGSDTSIGTLVSANTTGTNVGSYAIFYGGYNQTTSNVATRINNCGALVGQAAVTGATGNAGQAAGASVGQNAIFFGGAASGVRVNATFRVNACGAIVGTQTNLAGATAASTLGGAGV